MPAKSRTLRVLMAVATAAVSISWGGFAGATELEPTHKQIRMFQPKQAGAKTQLNTFCLDGEGNILACTSGKKNLIQVYSPELQLVREIELPFSATAINVGPNGTVYAGGSGQIAIVNAEGEIVSQHKSPQISDEENLVDRLEKAAKERLQKTLDSYDKQIEKIEGQIAKFEKNEELSERDQKRLETYQRQKKIIQSNKKQFEKTAVVDPATLIANARVRALAVTSKNVFVCCNSLEGHGYEVWKANLDLTGAEQLVSNVSGCCGQFDIQANEDFLMLAENTKFQVGLLDHDGKRISSFGKSNRMGGDGFGSCCNPMNVRCCDNGDILTAESSIGTIKRFSQSGELLGVIGKAKIGGGCKHVALGFDKARDRYYIQFEDKNGICVLVPKSEAPEFSEDELIAKKAAEGLGKKLVGDWSTNGKNSRRGLSSAITGLISGASSDPFLANVMKFSEDGKMVGNSPDLKWEAISAQDQSLLIAMEMEGVAYDLKVEFTTDDKIVISMLLGEQVYSTKKYTRIKDDTAQDKEQATDESGQ